MTKEQIVLVRKSWILIQQISPDIVADVFYSKLVQYRNMRKYVEKSNDEALYQPLVKLLSSIFNQLENLSAAEPQIQELMRLNESCGVEKGDYITIGNTILWVLKNAMGNEWTLQLETAWIACLFQLQEKMEKVTS